MKNLICKWFNLVGAAQLKRANRLISEQITDIERLNRIINSVDSEILMWKSTHHSAVLAYRKGETEGFSRGLKANPDIREVFNDGVRVGVESERTKHKKPTNGSADGGIVDYD